MNPPRPVIDLRSRAWRTQLKAALDQVLSEPIPQNIDQALRDMK